MKNIIFFLLCCALPLFADSTTDSLMTAVVKQCRADKMVFVEVDCAGIRSWYRVDNGTLLKTAKSVRPGGGTVDDWAEMGVLPVDAQMHPTAQGAGWLMHRTGGIWQRTAIDEGVGYAKEALRKGKVPSAVILKLKLQTAD